MSDQDTSGAGRSLEEARAAKQAAQRTFERLGTVAGIGITRSGDGYGLKVNLQRELPAQVEVPKMVEGVPVKVAVVGTIRKRSA